MAKIQLGSTGISIERNGFGCLPIQRVSKNEAVYLLQRAVDGGMNFFDTARFYTDSEEKIGAAFYHMRDKVVLASKSMALTGAELSKQLDETLKNLQTDYLDLYQLHNPPFCPMPGGEDGVYQALVEAKTAGKIRAIGITNHRLEVARVAVSSRFYDTLQFPFSYLAGAQELDLVAQCRETGMGFIAMKGMAGGLIRSGRAAFAYLSKFPGVVPIWGIQHRWELEEFLTCMDRPPTLEGELEDVIRKDREALAGEFCRGCGYCMPCPVGIEINQCARMTLMMGRARLEDQLTESMQRMMDKVQDCIHCGACKKKCPYNLDTPKLLEENWAEYQQVLNERNGQNRT